MIIKILLIFSAVLSAVSGGCSARRMQETADTQVRGIIDQKYERIPEETLPAEAREAFEVEPGEPVLLSLEDAILLSMENNRAYRSRREDVYLNILSLTYERYRFGSRYRVSGDLGWDRDSEGEETLSGRFNVRLLRILATGAEVAFDITQDFLRYLTGDRDRDLQTIISLNILQPLLRGAGREIALEGLVQAERDAVYAIRSFLRYQKDFYVDATDRYLDLLLLKTRQKNFHTNYESLRRTRERIEMLAEAGRLPSIQVDQARQNELNAYQRWISSINRYETALDNFKMHLALSPEAEVVLDRAMLDELIEDGIEETDIEIEEFMEFALRRRLDLITQYNRLEDAYRKVSVAGSGLRTGLDLRIGAGAGTERGSSLNFDFGNPSYSAGLELDAPADRMAERNQYVRALVNIERVEREFENMIDVVKLEIARQHRNLEEAYRSYDIQRNSLALAEQRIESIGMLLEAGRATTRDLLEAEEAHLSAQNELAAEIINHKMAYLRFLYFSERLEVDREGLWRADIYHEKSIEKDIQ